MRTALTRQDRLEIAHRQLVDAIEELVCGEDWKRMLRVGSRFHRYSFFNQLLIFSQRPDATHVAGFNRWKLMGRAVRRGEKGLAIFAPCRYKQNVEEGDGTGQEIFVVRGFKVVYVFDISQTEGEAIDDLDAVKPVLLSGETSLELWDTLVELAATRGYEVIRESRGSANGYCDFLGKRIGVRPDVAPLQAVKTLIHELGHALLHGEGDQPAREVAEVEVESVAFVVLNALGEDSSSYSFPYVARWAGGDLKLIAETGSRVVSCAREILAHLEGSALTPSPT